MVLAGLLAFVILPLWSKFCSYLWPLSHGMYLLKMAHRYLQKIYSSPALQSPPAQLTVSLACVLYLISSCDLVDAQLSKEETRSQVVQCFHDLQLYANDHWLDHVSALANSPTDSIPSGSSMLSLSQALERLTERHNELMNTKAWNTQADEYTLPSNLEESWPQLGISTATQNLLNRVSVDRSMSTEGDQITISSCTYTAKLAPSSFFFFSSLFSFSSELC